jgi:hypothetical protein
MPKDQPTRPDAPRPPEFAVNFRTVPRYDASVSFNGKRSVWLSRMLRPFGKLLFAWLARREKRRGRNDSRPA